MAAKKMLPFVAAKLVTVKYFMAGFVFTDSAECLSVKTNKKKLEGEDIRVKGISKMFTILVISNRTASRNM